MRNIKMREFKGILDTNSIIDKDEKAREQKRLKAYLKGHKYFTHKGKKYYVNPEQKKEYRSPDEPLLPEIII